MEHANPSGDHSKMAKITFLKQDYTIEAKEGTELLRIPFIDPSVPLKFGCRKGECGTCAIKILQGEENLSPQTKEEQATLSRLKLNGHRLACQCALNGDLLID